MQRTATVLVLMGGPDAEREVSLDSGGAVAEALRHTGRWRVVDRVIDQPDAGELASLAAEADADIVFPALHGQWGEGGPLQELLEEIGLPYVGSRPKSAMLAMNKIATKALLAARGVPTPSAMKLRPDEKCRIRPPLVLKPVDDGSSVDLRICRTDAEVDRARKELHPRREVLMAEQYIAGREVTVGILGSWNAAANGRGFTAHPHAEPLPLIEIIPAAEFYDYEAKYTRDDTRYVIRPELATGMAGHITSLAMLAFERLGCRDLARVDFLVDDRGPWFLELNTMPGFTSHSLVPMAARARGLALPDLCSRLVEAAASRDSRGESARPREQPAAAEEEAA